MSLSFDNAMQVFFFIILFSVYVCSILWMYGDSETRNMGMKGMVLPLILMIVSVLVLTKAYLWALLAWPISFIIWFIIRPKKPNVIIEEE